MTAKSRGEESRERRKLLQEELERYLSLLKSQPDPPERILLFGSMTGDENEVGPWSDLDLVVVQSTTLRFLDRIKALMALLQPRVGLDLLVYTPEEFEQMKAQRPFFQQEILAKGKVLYER
jgi:predicted nucleotidyltransferase